MNKIELADGTAFEGTCAVTGSFLLIKTTQDVVTKHFLDFMNPVKTAKITEYMTSIKTIYEGFTRFDTMNSGLDGIYNVFISAPGQFTNKRYFTVPREFVSDDMLGMAEFEEPTHERPRD